MAVTGNTTRADRAKRGLWLLLVLVAAAGVIALSWPRLHASLVYLPVEHAVDRYYARRDLPAAQIPALLSRARAAAAIQAHPRYFEGLSFLYYLQGNDRDGALYERRLAYEQSVQAAAQSLQLAPLQPALWLSKAHAGSWIFQPALDAVSAFKMSVFTGRVEPVLLLSRLQLGYSRLNSLDEEAVAMLRGQTLLAWQLRKRNVVQLLKSGQLNPVLVHGVLMPDHAGIVEEMKEAAGGSAR